jgi:hypothetical protein
MVGNEDVTELRASMARDFWHPWQNPHRKPKDANIESTLASLAKSAWKTANLTLTFGILPCATSWPNSGYA